jgi:hypothetical protein
LVSLARKYKTLRKSRENEIKDKEEGNRIEG